MRYRALSLRQPYATWLVEGRITKVGVWRASPYEGPLLIHASNIGRISGTLYTGPFSINCILGAVHVSGVVDVEAATKFPCWQPGFYGITTDARKKLVTPIPWLEQITLFGEWFEVPEQLAKPLLSIM